MTSQEHMSIGSWLLFMILMVIPLVNIGVFIILLISPDTNKSLKNYMIASVIPVIAAIVLVIAVLLPLMMSVQ